MIDINDRQQLRVNNRVQNMTWQGYTRSMVNSFIAKLGISRKQGTASPTSLNLKVSQHSSTGSITTMSSAQSSIRSHRRRSTRCSRQPISTLMLRRSISTVGRTLLGFLSPIAQHVAMMIAVKNGDMTTATAAMMTSRKARGPGNFVDAD